MSPFQKYMAKKNLHLMIHNDWTFTQNLRVNSNFFYVTCILY